MNKNHLSAVIAALSGCLLLPTPAAAEQDRTQVLLDLLVKRGILSSKDAGDFQRAVDAVPLNPAPASPPHSVTPASAAIGPMEAVPKSSPLGFHIGDAVFTPLGFVDFTTVYRNSNLGSGIGTNFASIPFSNTNAGQLSETRFSAQNSRIGLKMESTVGEAKVLGYLETDFLGNAPTNLGTSSNAATLRMRAYFVDVRYRDWEFLAGQDWSMMTPNRKGLSPLPSDIFFTSNMDTNYQAGLVWARQPQIRGVYHISSKWTAGLSLENPDQYAGGTNGSPAVTFPAGFNTGQVDTGAATSSPNLIPDVIAKTAFDTTFGGHALHAEVAGLLRTFKVNTSNVLGSDTAHGYGGSLNVDFEVLPNLHLIENAFISKGGGRYLFGQSPDFVVKSPNGDGRYTLSPVYSYSGMLGAEWQAFPKSLVFGYASVVGIGNSYTQLSNGTYIGYGFPGSANTNNHMIREFTLGETQTIWKSPARGALQIITQASYVERDPWSVAADSLHRAHLGMIFADIRYTLP